MTKLRLTSNKCFHYDIFNLIHELYNVTTFFSQNL